MILRKGKSQAISKQEYPPTQIIGPIRSFSTPKESKKFNKLFAFD
jgi:hypothetical protein